MVMKLTNQLQQYMNDYGEEKRNLNRLRPEYNTVRAQFVAKQREVFNKKKEFLGKRSELVAKGQKVAYLRRLRDSTAQKIKALESRIRSMTNKLVRFEKSENAMNSAKAKLRLQIRANQNAVNGSVNNINAVAENRANASRR
jgi:chromosome segregation ATPase